MRPRDCWCNTAYAYCTYAGSLSRVAHHRLVGGAGVAGGEPGFHAWCGLEQLRRRQGVAEDLGHIDVGDREAPPDDEAGLGEGLVQHGEGCAQGLDRSRGNLGVAVLGLVADAMIEHLDGVRLDLGGRPQRPHAHQSVLGQVGGRQRAAMLLGEIEVDRQRLVEHQPVVVDRGDVAVGIHLQELGLARVQRRLGGFRRSR